MRVKNSGRIRTFDDRYVRKNENEHARTHTHTHTHSHTHTHTHTHRAQRQPSVGSSGLKKKTKFVSNLEN